MSSSGLKELKNKNRDYIYDYLRVISCFFVIGIHTTDLLLYRIGLVMFVFLSGILSLSSIKEEPINTFYFKKFKKIVIPLYLFSFFYLFVYKYQYNLSQFSISNFAQDFDSVTENYIHFHLWYVYMITGIILITPYLKKMCKNLSDSECKSLFFLIFFISFVIYTLPSFGINIGIITSTPLNGWLLIYLLGYLSTKKFIIEKYKLFYLLGIISFIFNFFAFKFQFNLTNLNDLAITMMFQAIAFFLFFYKNKKKICKFNVLNKIILHISRYTYYIYLIHAFVITVITNYLSKFYLERMAVLVITNILAPILSYLLIIIIDKLFIYNIKKVIKKVKLKY